MTSLPNSKTNNKPKVSCLLVTADRRELLKRSLYSYRSQTYDNTELVVVDNGKDGIKDLLSDFNNVQYIRAEPSPENMLGDLRNISLDHATGQYLTCWDDDDWFHPKRVETQLSVIEEGFDACCLTGNLFHIDTERFMDHPYRGSLPDGSPSTILHRRNDDIRYPSLDRGEDTVYLNKWMERDCLDYKAISLNYSYLFVRCFHGTNVSGKKHFLRRLKNSPLKWFRYQWYKTFKNCLFEHPSFKLSEKETESFNIFLSDSKKFNLI